MAILSRHSTVQPSQFEEMDPIDAHILAEEVLRMRNEEQEAAMNVRGEELDAVVKTINGGCRAIVETIAKRPVL